MTGEDIWNSFIEDVPLETTKPVEIHSPELPAVIPPYEYPTTTNPGIYRRTIVLEYSRYVAILAGYNAFSAIAIGQAQDMLMVEYSIAVQVHGGDPGRFRAHVYLGPQNVLIWAKNVCCSHVSSSNIAGQAGIVIKQDCLLSINFDAEIGAGNCQIIVDLVLLPFR